MGIISWYEGDNDYPAARKAKMKALSVKWLALLNEEHADGNFSGTQKLYETLRMKHKEDGAQAYPSRSFVNDFLQRQFNEQRFKRTKKSDTIQAIVSSRPLQMIQVDYLYFYYPSSGIEDARKQGPIEEVDAKTGEEDPSFKEKEKEVVALFKKRKHPGSGYRGCIVAVDAFSRFAVTVPILGNINAASALDALKEIIKEFNREFPQHRNLIRIIQTDKGSEFLGVFRDYLIEKNRREKGQYYKHILSFTGRSQSSSLVERVNGTIKRLTVKILGSLEKDWRPALAAATEVYNSNYHSTIKTSPDSVSGMDAAGSKKIKDRIYDRAKRRHTIVRQEYKAGDYVRLKIQKPKKLEPTFTYRKGLATSLAKDKRFDNDTTEEFAGVFMVAGFRMGRSAIKEGPASDSDKPARATVYKIIHNWSKESQISTVPSGQKLARDPTRRIRVVDSVLFNGMSYPKGAYSRNFLASELTRVPQDDYGLPIVEDQPFVPLKDRKKKGQKKYEIEKIISRRKKEEADGYVFVYKVKFKGYPADTNQDYSVVKGTAALDDYYKDNPPFK